MTSPSPSTEATEGELCLTISPYGHIEWRGPRAKLEAIGVVPPHIKWPERLDYADWQAGGFDFMLRRCRPDGFKGPMRGWNDFDYWFVHRVDHRPEGERWTIYPPHAELGAVLSQAVCCGEAIWIDFAKPTTKKKGFEMLKARLVP
jgi:hypothetical protein